MGPRRFAQSPSCFDVDLMVVDASGRRQEESIMQNGLSTQIRVEAKILKISNETLETLKIQYYLEHGDRSPRSIRDLLEVVT
jgi:hypothetical protein